MEKWYFETSALNHFAKSHDYQDAIATKAHQLLKGRLWVISPVCIWEILATQDEFERERLIFIAQNLFDENLLPGPGELILKFIFQGCPLVEKRRELKSESDLAETWKNLVGCNQKTFVFDKGQLNEALSNLKDLNRRIFSLARNEPEYFEDSSESDLLVLLDTTISAIGDEHKLPAGVDSKIVLRISLYYLICAVCAGAGLEMPVINKLWEQRGIKDPIDRYYYVIKNFPEVLYRGPLALLAMMTYVQTRQKFSRGVLFDSFHAIYSVYCEKLLTNDKHFVWLRDEISPSLAALSIYHFDELKITYTERSNAPDRGIIAT